MNEKINRAFAALSIWEVVLLIVGVFLIYGSYMEIQPSLQNRQVMEDLVVAVDYGMEHRVMDSMCVARLNKDYSRKANMILAAELFPEVVKDIPCDTGIVFMLVSNEGTPLVLIEKHGK